MLPRYEGKENCTFTVRIPRFYLSDLEREEITRHRAVWGCNIYTDDSDPLAAAIHSGWVQGSWGDDVDASMLELPPSTSRPPGKALAINANANELAPNTPTMASPPPQPITPPKDRDLHLTCLVLPPLQEYPSKICHGIKSRAWGDNHDGMSFRIEKIEWVDEGIGKSEERTAEAKRRRMRNMAEERKSMVGKNYISPVVTIGGGLGDFAGKSQDVVMVGA